MDYTVSYNRYLSKETTRALKKLLHNTKTVPEIQVNGKTYMERKDYRKLQGNRAGFEKIMPVYGVVQLLNLFEERTERVRITSKSNSMVSDLHVQLKKLVLVIPDIIVANRNEIEIIPQGTFES